MNKTVILSIILGAAFLIALVYSSFGNAAFRCEVCMTFEGRKACKAAAAKSREQALRAATDLACAQISSGMSESTRCVNTPADSVKWLTQR